MPHSDPYGAVPFTSNYWGTPSYPLTRRGERGKYDLRVARKSWQRLKMKIKAITRKTTPASLEERIERLNSLMYGWVGYFQMGKIWGKLRELDAWIRNRLRYCTRLPDGQVWSRFINREEETQPPNARIPAARDRIRNRLLLVTLPYGRLGYRPIAHHAYHGNGGTPR